jgi:hypothetical protein
LSKYAIFVVELAISFDVNAVRKGYMPQGFSTLLNSNVSSNSAGLDQNCYYCSIAALLGTDTSSLVTRTEIMQQDTADESHIVALMGAAGIAGPNYLTFHSQLPFEGAIASLPAGQALGLAYRRTDQTGHMIVYAHSALGLRGYIDYQNNPPTCTPAFPEAMGNIVSMALFFRA